MSNQNINSLETIYVLNDKYQYEPGVQSTNAKWLDENQVVSVKRDKTIYAIRARNTLNFDGNTNQEFFANVDGKSNLYRNFGSNTEQSILMTNPAPVYGNINASQVGVAGSLINGFSYVDNGDGSINVDSNVNVTSNGRNVSSLPSNLQKLPNGDVQQNAGFGNVNNNTCDRILHVTSNIAAPVWNRLINANMNGNVLVNCSTDPCDLNGNAIPSSPSAVSGDAVTNEVYREQVAVRLNSTINSANVSINNPVYIASVSPFGSNISGTAGVVGNISLHSFSGNFFANLPADNALYANGNILTNISISGTITTPSLSLFNSNVLVAGNLLDGINLNNVPGTKSSLNTVVDVKINSNVAENDLDIITNSNEICDIYGDLTSVGTFDTGDKVMIVQGNITIDPLYLIDRLSLTDSTKFVLASNVFSNGAGDNRNSVSGDINTEDLSYYSITANAAVQGKSAKYLYLLGNTISAENWEEILPNVVASISPNGIPDQSEYVTGNIVDIYVQRGSIGVSNYTSYANKTNSGVWVKSIPSFMNTFSEPNGNAYLDNTVFGNVGTTSKNINIGSVGNPINISANLVDNYNFYFFGNSSTESRADKRVGNVVVNVNSVMANVWNYDNNGEANSSATTEWSPMVVYGNVSPSSNSSIVRPLSFSNPFANVNVDYRLEFPSYVGQTDAPSSGNWSFFANISNDGLAGNANASSLSQFNLDNNSAVNDILLNDVVSTEFTVNAISYKYTDIGTVVLQNASNSEFNAVLPFAGNVLSSNIGTNGYAIGDVAMNVIVDYFQNPVLLTGSADNVHRLTIYDVQYRYAITNVIRSGASPLSTKLTINGLTDLATNLVTTNGNVDGNVSAVNDNVAAPEFTLFMYDSVSEFSSTDTLYPFTDVNSDETDRWFPGFNYRNGEWYSSKTDAEVDFTIEPNTTSEQNVNFLFQAVNLGGNTVSVAKSTDNAFKSIPIRKIRFGSSAGSHPYYGYIVVKVRTEASSYVVILYKLDSAGSNYDSNISTALPVMVNVKSIELSSVGSKQQVEFKSSLRVYEPNSNSLVQSFTNTVNSHKSPLSLFTYSTVYGSNDTSIGVNTYAAPPSNAIMQWAYKQSVIRELVNYEYVNKTLDGMSGYTDIPSQTAGTILFAITEVNTSTSAIPDINNANLAKIPALSRRCYLDAGYGNGVYVDILNSYAWTEPIEFYVDRSVEWVLSRKLAGESDESYEPVGRGLISRAREELVSYETRDYLILENDLTKETSGFQMVVNTNVVDLSARLLAQSISTGSLKNGSSNELALKITTVSDSLAMVVYKVNPVSGVEDSNQFLGPYLYSASAGSSIDLAALLMGNSNYNGQLPSFTLSTIRGYQYSEDLIPLNALFSVNYTRDNYAIIQLFQNGNGGKLENGDNITFSRNNATKFELYCADLNVTFNNVVGKGTLNRDFASPNIAAGDFVKYASWKHNGFGNVSYKFSDFTANYGKTLPTQTIQSGGLTPRFNFSSNDAYKVSPLNNITLSSSIKYDSNVNKYYASIGPDKLYFRGTGLGSLPVQLNNKDTVLLYTGTKPMVVSTLTMNGGSTLENMRDGVATVVSANMFNTTNWLTYTSGSIASQIYAVFFTNESVVNSSNNYVQVRSLKITPKSDYFANSQFYLGSFINSSELLTNNLVNVTYGTNGSYNYPFSIARQIDINNTQLAQINPVQSIDTITSAAGAVTTTYPTYKCINNVFGELFSITIKNEADLPKIEYNINIEPATVHMYEAIDTDRNGELDISDFGLDAAFSELLYTLTPVTETSKVNVPKVVDSWTLDRAFHNIKGSTLDINMNVKWNVGYNLGNFFTIRQNNEAVFDVITVHTEYNSSANNKNMTNLVVSPMSELVISSKNSWAHAPQNSALTGLAFKLKGYSVTAGETVRLFVENDVPTNNTLQLNVGSTTGSTTYRLSSYDQERYAVLLDEQIRFTNNIK